MPTEGYLLKRVFSSGPILVPSKRQDRFPGKPINALSKAPPPPRSLSLASHSRVQVTLGEEGPFARRYL